MRVIAKTGDEDIAVVYIAKSDNGRLIEFVESIQPPLSREEKWVLMISTLYGCPIGCKFCDAGGWYKGVLDKNEILWQINYLINNRFPDNSVPVKKFKIQFARMGEPSFNPAVIDILEELPELYDAPGLLPSLSTVAPIGCKNFFEKLLKVKKNLYPTRFQLQFSIHTTDVEKRNWLIPIRKWSFKEIAEYGKQFFDEDGRKITLNFALAEDMPVEPEILLEYFNPDIFLIKITPVNPTYSAYKNNITSHISSDEREYDIVNHLREVGYEVILSIGEIMENYIGSNCGQYINRYLNSKESLQNSYTFPLHYI
ncbi:MAG: radical SAM protein [Thermoplasmata archaeon]|nr:MAG: radical SAM protein [Thermoplasmata archaeon]